MESLLSDASLSILSRVPIESVLECKLVCKKWHTLIHQSETYFTNMHFSHQLKQLYDDDDNNVAPEVQPSLFFACRKEEFVGPTWLYHGGKIADKISANEKYSYKENLKKINHPPMHDEEYDHFVGSCNGLMCVSVRHHQVLDPIYIFNPVTREYVYLPELVVEPLADTEGGEVDMLGRVSSGFGYVRSTNEYKIVRIHYYPWAVTEKHVAVYTLGSGCGWRAKGKTRFLFSKSNDAGTYVNGALYWTGSGNKNIVAFDLASEEFKLLPYPPCMDNNVRPNNPRGLVALGGQLCFFLEKLRLEIWSLKKKVNENGDTKEFWCLDFNIGFEGVAVDRKWTWFTPVLLTGSGELILIFDDSALYCYDPKTTTLKMVSDDNEVSMQYFGKVKAIPHINTFVSLKAMGEKSKRYLVSDTWEGNNDIEQLEGASLV